MFGLRKIKYDNFDIALTKRDHEKVTVLKPIESDDGRNEDLGQRYLIRDQENKTRTVFEGELMTLDEAIEATKPKSAY